MSENFQKAINELNNSFLNYCTEVEENLQLAIQSFMNTELENVQVVIEKDKEIDQMEISIEEECLQIIAMHQPVAKDLRFIVSILKMNNDLERIGDLAVNIVKKVTIFSNQDMTLAKDENSFLLPDMTMKSLNMLKKSLNSFSKKDPDLARTVCQMDDEVDELKQQMKILVLNEMKKSPDRIKTLSSILRNSYHLERIADLSTNIAEDVIYFIEGDIIRHNIQKYNTLVKD